MNEVSVSEILTDERVGDGGTYPDLLRHMARCDPGTVAIEWSGGTVSYAQLLAMVAAEAEYLTSVGVGPGDVVASMVTGHPYSLANHMAVALVGGISAPVYIENEGKVLARTLNVFQAKVVVAMPEAVPKVEAVMASVPTLGRIIEMLDSDFDRIMQEGRDIGPWLEAAHPHPEDPCLLLTTSGTTGTPKAVVFPQATANRGYLMARKWGLEGTPKVYITTSWGHGAVTWQVAIGFWFGGSVVLPDRFSASGFWEDVRRYQCTHALLFGPMIRATFNQMEERGIDIPADLDFVMISSGMPLDIWHRLVDAGIRVSELYSTTELMNSGGPSCVVLSNPDGRYQRGSVGRPWEEIQARLVDDEGNEVAEGEPGELQMKPVGQDAVVRYWNNDQAAAELIVDGWVRTGDYFRRQDGDYFFVSRKRDIIRRRGVNMSPGAIEDEIQKHPGIEAVVAMAVPSALGEDEIKVVVVPTKYGGVDHSGIAAFAEAVLPRHMCPRYIEIMDSLPVTQGNGRPKRAQLEKAWDTESTWDTIENGFLRRDEATAGPLS